MIRTQPLSKYLFSIMTSIIKDLGVVFTLKEWQEGLEDGATRKYITSFRDIDERDVYACSFKFDGSAVTSNRSLATGKRYNKISIVTIRAQGDTDEAGLYAPEVFLENAQELLTDTYNHIYYVNSNMELMETSGEDCLEIGIKEITNLSDIIDLHKNEELIPRFSLKLKVEYNVVRK